MTLLTLNLKKLTLKFIWLMLATCTIFSIKIYANTKVITKNISNEIKHKQHKKKLAKTKESNLDFTKICPPDVVALINRADLKSSDSAPLFSRFQSITNLDCQLAAVEVIAQRLTPLSHQQILTDFFYAVGTYGRLLNPKLKLTIKEAYLRLPYDNIYAVGYFAGLTMAKIDIRDQVKDYVAEDWSFTHPRNNASTWHYNMYLASLGDKQALKKIANKIAKTTNGNDATNLLESLSGLEADGVDEILLSYENDQRTSDGPDGPGPTISEMVKMYMTIRKN